MMSKWEPKRLGEVTRIIMGQSPAGDSYNVVGEGVPLINGPVEFSEGPFGKTIRSKFTTEPTKFCDKGDLILCVRGSTTGRMNIAGFVACIGRGVAAIRAEEYQPWINYFINWKRDEIYRLGTGATFPNVSGLVLNELPILMPPVSEQKRIVEVLDQAFAGLAIAQTNAQKNLQNARALFESQLHSVFINRGKGWMEKKVSEIAKHSLGKMLDKAKNKGEPKPYLRNLNVRWFTFDLSYLLEMRFLSEEESKYTASKGDVLICEGGYPGRAAIWDQDEPIYFQKALHRVRFHQPEHNKWFVYYLYAQDQSGELRQHFKGAGIQHFTGEGLAQFQVPLPPLPELRRAVAKFDALAAETQRLARLYEQKLAALSELKKSLLHQAFTGEL